MSTTLMTTAADNISLLNAGVGDAALTPGERAIIAWSCIRKRRGQSAAPLERARFLLGLHVLDRQHGMLEAWLESDGNRVQTVLAAISRPLTLCAHAGMTHVDIAGADGSCLLSMTLANAGRRVIYARTSLLAQSSLVGGTYDPPALHGCEEATRTARSA